MILKAAFLMILTILSVSCAQDTGDDVLSVALSQEPPVLDVQLNPSISGRMIMLGNVFERPVVLDGDGRIREELAESFSLSEDGRKLSFVMRDDVLFHDGTVMEGSDAAASLNRWLSLYSQADQAASGHRFVSSGNEVHIESEGSLLMLLMMIASSPQGAVIMPEECAGETSVLSSFIGTGPYRLQSWRPGEKVSLVSFEGYRPYAEGEADGLWGDKSAGPEAITYYFVPDGTTRRLGLESGLYDAVDCILSDDIPSLMENGDVRLLEGDENGSIALVFNKRHGVFRDVRMRRAVALTVDRDTLMQACYGSYGYVLRPDYMESGLWSVDPALDPYGQTDPGAAAVLTGEAGYDGEVVRILSSNTSNLDKIAVALASELEKAGIRSEVEVLDWASFIERRKDPEAWDIFISAYTRTVLPQLKTYLSPTLPGWLDDEASLSLLEAISGAESLDEAAELWQEAQIMLWQSVPVIVPGHYSTVYGVSSSLDGTIVGDGLYFWAASLSE